MTWGLAPNESLAKFQRSALMPLDCAYLLRVRERVCYPFVYKRRDSWCSGHVFQSVADGRQREVFIHKQVACAFSPPATTCSGWFGLQAG